FDIASGKNPLEIHKTPVKKKTIATRISFLSIGPNFFNSSLAKVEDISSFTSNLNFILVIYKNKNASKTIVIGKPNINQSVNVILASKVLFAIPTSTAFGTEPIIVANPPIEAE